MGRLVSSILIGSEGLGSPDFAPHFFWCWFDLLASQSGPGADSLARPVRTQGVAMTKADKIRELYATGKYTTTQIGEIVGCSGAYVRVVARQRSKGGSWQKAYFAGDRTKAQKAGRLAYKRALKEGKTTYQARGYYGRAFSNTMYRTGRAHV